MFRARATAAVLLSAASATFLSGCGTAPGRMQAVSGAADEFRVAAAAADSSTVCELLTERVRQSLEEDGQPCPAAVTERGLRDPGTVTSTQVWGRDALVTYAGTGSDVFWTEVNGDWRIVAAGCTRDEQAPADCELEAG